MCKLSGAYDLHFWMWQTNRQLFNMKMMREKNSWLNFVVVKLMPQHECELCVSFLFSFFSFFFLTVILKPWVVSQEQHAWTFPRLIYTSHTSIHMVHSSQPSVDPNSKIVRCLYNIASGCYKIIGFVPFNFNTVLNGLNAVVFKKHFILPSLTVHVVCFIDHLTSWTLVSLC